MTDANRPDLTTLRALAVRHGCDPRSILAALRGANVRGPAGQRARAAADAWLAQQSRESATRCDEDGFGVPRWHDSEHGGTLHAAWYDPFERHLEALIRAGEEEVGDVGVKVRDGLETARAIALSIWGRAWSHHVLEVYDRMQARRGEG